MNGLVIGYANEAIRSEAKRRGIRVVTTDEPVIAFDQTLLVGPGADVPWDLLDAGFHFLERWDAAAPLWRYGILAAHIGAPAERDRTETLTLDLRVPVYAADLLLLVRRSSSGLALIESWQQECADGADQRLAFGQWRCWMSLTSSTLAHLRDTYGDWMRDTCVHVTRSTSQDSYGQPVETWSDALTYACGLDLRGGREVRQAAQTPIILDGRVRLPLAALGVVLATHRIRVTKRYGDTLSSPLTFEIEGEPRPGPLGLVCDLRRVS